MHLKSTFVYQINYTIQNHLKFLCGIFCLTPIMMHANNIPLIYGITSFSDDSTEANVCNTVYEDILKSSLTSTKTGFAPAVTIAPIVA